MEGKKSWCCLKSIPDESDGNTSKFSVEHPFHNATGRFHEWHTKNTKKMIMTSQMNPTVRHSHTMSTNNLEPTFREKKSYIGENESLEVHFLVFFHDQYYGSLF